MDLTLKLLIVLWFWSQFNTNLFTDTQSQEVNHRLTHENVHLKNRLKKKNGPQLRTYDISNNSQLNKGPIKSPVSKPLRPKNPKKKLFSRTETKSGYVNSLVANFGFLFSFLITSLVIILLVICIGTEYFRSNSHFY